MSIFKHFVNLNLSLDQTVALEKLEVFISSPLQVFILKGYAGSGKTTILKGLIGYLQANNFEFLVMAPTGRAAKILKDKTGRGSTIHRGIYKLDRMETLQTDAEDVADQSYHYHFPIQNIDKSKQIIIVDEASMISNVKSTQELFSYGTDILFQDLLTYSKIASTYSKIIFVGDPAQLPPVGDNKSTALSSEFYISAGISYDEVEMEYVFRQDSENGLILKNAAKIRELLNEEKRNQLFLEFDKESMVEIPASETASKYVELFPIPNLGNGVVISYSNAQAYAYNVSIREKLFPNEPNLVAGDIVILNNNNYNYYGTELFNGDLAKILEVSPNIENISAPVMVSVGNKKTRKNITISLREVKLKLNNTSTEIKCKIFDGLLNSPDRDLSADQQKAIYIHFVMRFNEEQKQRELKGEVKYKVGSEEFKRAIQKDPYTNALRIKYGYAVTCHKAQGGEWDTVFVDYTGRVGLNDDSLRWAYTATTRAVKSCFAINAPSFSVFSKFSFSEIIKTTNSPLNALYLHNIPTSPFHTLNQHKCKSRKYWEVHSKISNSAYSLVSVESRGDYLERYIFKLGSEEFIAQITHDKAGFFGLFQILSQGDYSNLLEILNKEEGYNIVPEYTPSDKPLHELYSQIQSICYDLNISITNIIETNAQYYVTYFLKTSGKFSYIQFYFSNQGNFTSAMPKSDLGRDDIKLVQLIERLSSNAG